MKSFIFIVLAVFSVQVLDIPPLHRTQNPRTCCGRTVCLCQHGKGAPCSFRHGKQAKAVSPTVSHMSCHLNRSAKIPDDSKIKKMPPKTGLAFTKAPCASDTPKTVLREYSTHFLLPSKTAACELIPCGGISFSSFDAGPLLTGKGIDRPPRIL